MSPKLTLKERLVRYLINNHGWIASGELQRLVMEKTKFTPQTAGRVLRKLAEAGVIEVSYRKHHAYYRVLQTTVEAQKPKTRIEIKGGVAVQVPAN